MSAASNDRFIELYMGVSIYWNIEDGFWGQNGAQCFGYCDTAREIHAEICDAQSDPDDFDIPEDTPSIDDFMRRYEMETAL